MGWRRGAGLLAISLAACGRGDYPSSWEPAKYFTPAARSQEIDTIVIHTTEGPYDEKRPFLQNQEETYRWTVKYFKDPAPRKVSAHYVVGPHGEVTRMVEEHDIAWHATYYNPRSIGIECAGWSGRAETWNPELLAALADLVAHLAAKYSVVVEHPDETALSSPTGFFTGKGIIGHYQVQTPGSKAVQVHSERTDPGPHFPWPEFIERVHLRLAPSSR
jgi:N-acetyl-anhydromuramyl-L-alanine amidase AmpD